MSRKSERSPDIKTRSDYAYALYILETRYAQENFWTFCQVMYPEFYKDDRLYLKDLCDTLQDFYEGKIDKKILIINMPPRHGKTFTARLFVLWLFGQDKRTKIITGSYNQILSSLFAQQTRDGIMAENINGRDKYFSDIFPDVKIKQGDAAKGFWSLEESEEKNYLATSPGGTSTGIGANYVLVDDIIKNSEEANNENNKMKHWEWYNNTLVQRMERPRKQILIMTRWSSDDLAGRMIESRTDECHVITYKAVQPDGSMLCDDIMTYDEYLSTIKEMGKDTASANYQQEPLDLKGRLYTKFKTYDVLPTFEAIRSVTDTADEGADFLCSIVYGVFKKEAYVRDVIYTDLPMEKTEIMVAKMHHERRVNLAKIESNNGGRGFARGVERILKEEYDTNHTVVKWFHQSKNKIARILTNAPWVMEHIYYPPDWQNLWPEYALAMMKYSRDGKNAHDDAPDCTTMIAEEISGKKGMNVLE